MPRLLKILLVDDSKADRTLFRLALENSSRFSVRTTEASTFTEAISLLAREEFDAIFLDLGLPDSQGLEAVSALREYIETPFLVLTGNANERMAQEALALGASDYLLKNDVREPSMLARALEYAIERHRSLEIRREAEKLQMRVQQQHSIDLLMRAVAHDLGNLLTPIRIYAWKGRQLEDPEARSIFEEIGKSVTLASDLLQRLHTLRKAEKNDLQSHPLRTVRLLSAFEETLDLLRRVVPAPIELKVETDDAVRDARIQLDEASFPHALLNLTINAVQAMRSKESGSITIRIRPAATDETSPSLPWLCIEIIDNGIGMDAETRDKLFSEPFTTKGDQGGSGLGLLSVRHFVDRHRGRLEIESSPDEGSCIRLLLPPFETEISKLSHRLAHPSLSATSTPAPAP